MCFLRTSVISVFSVDSASFSLFCRNICSLAFHCSAWARVSVMMTKSSAYRTRHPGINDVLYRAPRLFPGLAYICLVFPLLGNPLIHNVQVGIRQQWTDDTALWGSILIYGTFIHNPSFQHGLDDLQNAPILDAYMV